jgi:hypothetical protein
VQKRVIGILIVFTFLFISGCSNNSVSENSQKKSIADSDLNTSLLKSERFEKVAESESLELYINGKTTEFSVLDKTTGNMWYSNPQDRSVDQSAQGKGKTYLDSQIVLSYNDSSDKKSELNNYDDCVINQQYKFSPIKNGVRVTYKIGKVTKDYLAPQIVEKTRFESLIKSQLSGDDLSLIESYYILQSKKDFRPDVYKEIKQKYPTIDKYDIYTLIPDMPDYVLEDIQRIMLTTKYTQNNKAYDDKVNLVKFSNDNINFEIPVEYQLENDNFVARVITKDISYNKDIYLNSLVFLPSFGAGNKTENGYFFVPDGCGALINFNNGKSNYGQYEKPVYGEDLSVMQDDKKIGKAENINLPIYGINKGNKGLLAFLEDGASAANIMANVSGYMNSYNQCYVKYNIRPNDTVFLSFSKDKGRYVYPAKDLTSNMQIRYKFLNEKKSDYNGMAKEYQQYLLNNKKINSVLFKENIPFYLDLLGSVKYKTLFLGFPIQGNKVLTSFNDAQKLIKKLNNDGINEISLKYTGAVNGGLKPQVPNGFSITKELGNEKDLQLLQKNLTTKNSNLFMEVNLQRVEKIGAFSGFNYNKDSAKSYSTEPAKYKTYSLATNQSIGFSYLISPRLYEYYISKILNGSKTYGIKKLSLGDYGKNLYSDNNKNNFYDRERSKVEIEKSLKTMQDHTSIQLNAPNDYSFQSVNEIADVPDSSSDYYIFDKNIPFYQMVIHGLLSYSSMPINLESDVQTAVLKAAQTGAALKYKWIFKPNFELKNTEESYYSLNYETWYDQAVKLYNDYNRTFMDLQNVKIQSFTYITDSLTKTIYENDVIVYVNLSNNVQKTGNLTIDAKSYKRMRLEVLK